jgi:hypothetical protein
MSTSARQRDPRLDFFRGLGMFIILIAHITNNPWTMWIPARFGFSDATEIFVFCSGMASAIAFGAVYARAGWLMGTLQIAGRIWTVYWVHLGVFFVTLMLMFTLNQTGVFPRDEVGALNLYPFLKNTGANLIGLMTTYVPELLRHPADVSGDPCADPGDDGAGPDRCAAGLCPEPRALGRWDGGAEPACRIVVHQAPRTGPGSSTPLPGSWCSSPALR